jgi:hypothetical protein
MIIRLYHANNHVMLSLTDQLVPSLVKVLTGDEGDEEQVKLDTKGELFELLKALRREYPHLFEAYSGFMLPQ